MPTVVPPRYGVFSVHIQGPNPKTDCVVTIGLWRAAVTATNDATVTEVFENAVDAFTTFFTPSLVNTYTINRFRLAGTEADGPYVRESNVSIVGAANATAMPPNVAMLVKKRTQSPGRQNRGRMYLPGCLDINSVLPTGAVASNNYNIIQGRLNTLLQNLEHHDLPVVLGNEKTHAVVLHNNPALSPTRITSLQLDPMVATQRRRIR